MKLLTPLDPPPAMPTMIGSVQMFESADAAIAEFEDSGFELVERTASTVRLVRDNRRFEAYAERTTGNQWRGYIAQLPEPITTTPQENPDGEEEARRDDDGQ